MRPRCYRRIQRDPLVTYFKPVGIPLRSLEEVVLLVEEYEALRLADAEGKEQKAAAEEMGVSQPTFHRILKSARHKMARALAEGKALRITGGTYVPLESPLRRRMRRRGSL